MDEESQEFAVGIISDELLGDCAQIRAEYLSRFRPELWEFVAVMASTYLHWKKFDKAVEGSEDRAHISALLYGTINALVITRSIKLIAIYGVAYRTCFSEKYRATI